MNTRFSFCCQHMLQYRNHCTERKLHQRKAFRYVSVCRCVCVCVRVCVCVCVCFWVHAFVLVYIYLYSLSVRVGHYKCTKSNVHISALDTVLLR